MKFLAKLVSKIWDKTENMSFATTQSRALFGALVSRGVPAKLEHSDGYKTVDIAIPDSKLYVEIDGIHHFTKPEQIIADLGRSYYSNADGFNTFHVTNQIIEKYLNEVADALVEVIKLRKNKKPCEH